MSRICVTSVTPGAIDLPSATSGSYPFRLEKPRRLREAQERNRTTRSWRGRGRRRLRAAYPSFLAGNSAESVKLLLPMLAIVEEAPNRLFDQFVAAPIVATGEFLLDLSKEENAEAGPCTAGSRTSPNPLSSIPSCP